MNEEQVNNTERLLDTTDCLEAIGVFRFWKNIFFVIIILSLLLLQVSFWLVELGYIKADEAKSEAAVVSVEEQQGAVTIAAVETQQIAEAAQQVVTEPNKPTEATVEQPEPQKGLPFPNIKFKHLAWLIRLLNFVLIPVALLHCLTMLFSLKVSLLGRLGGINHIARAFFLSLIAAVFLLPWWQKLFGGVFVGVMYTPQELLSRCVSVRDGDCNIFCAVRHYGRFTGYWFVVVLFYMFSQLRSGRWTKTILRRLEVI